MISNDYPSKNLLHVYAQPHVRRRVCEYLGGDTPESVTCVYLTHSDGYGFRALDRFDPSEMEWFFQYDIDIARSLQDREDFLVHLDLEYVNFDAPCAAFLDPWNAFELQDPVVRVTEEVFSSFGIRPLHLVTGRGHHFVWRLRKTSPLFSQLARLRDSDHFKAHGIAEGEVVDMETLAFAGLALVMEYLGGEIQRLAAPSTMVPVEITALHVGKSTTSDREIVSIDLSEYGDPIASRVIRVPFSIYRKPWECGLTHLLTSANEVPRIFTIPLHEMDWRQALKVRQDTGDVINLARRSCTRIPLQEEGFANLLHAYLSSPLRTYHEWYDREAPDAEPAARLPWNALSPCVSRLFSEPNDMLLKPSGIQLATRALLALGWHPVQIVQALERCFTDPRHDWGEQWSIYDPRMRAEFYVRLFAGLILTRRDSYVDFNCTSTQEKGFCFGANGCSLSSYQKELTNMKPFTRHG